MPHESRTALELAVVRLQRLRMGISRFWRTQVMTSALRPLGCAAQSSYRQSGFDHFGRVLTEVRLVGG